MTNRNDIAIHIRKLVKKYRKHPWDINCGQCEDFAEDLLELVGEGEVIDVTDLDEDWQPEDDGIYHFVFVFKDMFFDAEEPYGARDWRHLPLCARALRSRERSRKGLSEDDP
jgi:hypothetical protein